MRDMPQRIDLDSVLQNGVINGSTADTDVFTDQNIVADTDAAKMLPS